MTAAAGDTLSADDPTSVRTSRAVMVGLAAGTLSGLFGIGGGIVIVPGLIALTALGRRLAHGTSLAATLPIATASFVTYAVGGNVDWRVAAALAVGAIIGTVVGTELLHVIPRNPLIIIFIVTVLATAVRLVLADDTTGRDPMTVGVVIGMIAVGLVTGILSGLLGIGGGVVMVPAMIVLLSMTPVLAKGTSVAVIVPSAIVGTLRNRSHANVDLRAAAVVGAGGVVSAVIASLVSDRIPAEVSNVMFAGLLVVVAGIQIRSLVSGDD